MKDLNEKLKKLIEFAKTLGFEDTLIMQDEITHDWEPVDGNPKDLRKIPAKTKGEFETVLALGSFPQCDENIVDAMITTQDPEADEDDEFASIVKMSPHLAADTDNSH